MIKNIFEKQIILKILGLSLAAIVALVMYKTGAFSKLRFFKDRLDEEEENENKRQSMRYPEHNE